MNGEKRGQQRRPAVNQAEQVTAGETAPILKDAAMKSILKFLWHAGGVFGLFISAFLLAQMAERENNWLFVVGELACIRAAFEALYHGLEWRMPPKPAGRS